MYVIINNRMLSEMTTSAFMKSDPDADIRPVSAQTAHRWVRDDFPHDTPLWIDSDNRIRRATDNNS
jgi:hypothetical protein